MWGFRPGKDNSCCAYCCRHSSVTPMVSEERSEVLLHRYGGHYVHTIEGDDSPAKWALSCCCGDTFTRIRMARNAASCCCTELCGGPHVYIRREFGALDVCVRQRAWCPRERDWWCCTRCAVSGFIFSLQQKKHVVHTAVVVAVVGALLTLTWLRGMQQALRAAQLAAATTIAERVARSAFCVVLCLPS